jgi:hypothetical protein
VRHFFYCLLDEFPAETFLPSDFSPVLNMNTRSEYNSLGIPRVSARLIVLTIVCQKQ